MKPIARLRSPLTLFVLLSVLTALVYLSVSRAYGYVGFGLDDAWIHQTYARNLGMRGEFAFIPGRPSAGSTAPLWTGLIALGYMLRLEPRLWTYALGAASLSLAAWLAHRLVAVYWPERRMAALLAGAVVALEWHLGWAAMSGMETVLFAALALAAFALPEERPGWLGLVAGFSVLLRPDGLTLLPFVAARLVWPRWRGWKALLHLLAAFAAVFGLYLGFNFWLSGSPWPNTFYAKQAEYAVMREFPLWARAVWRCELNGRCEPGVALLPWIGAQVLLLPGLAAGAVRAVQERRWEQLLPLLWAGAFIAAYVLRLPVSYQYGRYVMPVIPVLIVLGVGGVWELWRLHSERLWPRVLSRTWAAAFGALALIFWGQGALLYARDVRIIETEMAATARWVAANTPPGALIAAHDIGALGYFGNRPLLDLAGLISPEVIGFIRDEARLADWLTRQGAEYLVTFPGWYPKLTEAVAAQEVFRTGAPYSPAAGGENMAVYRWPPAFTSANER
ncbi:MAG: hypothetical protein RMK99_04935 [Anaerolineales bacterium]|nr:hypothetical protein [Anaerolineales bacterium]